MNNDNKIKSINKKLETIFKAIKNLHFEDIDKILFNIELLKNKHLNRIKQNNVDLYEDNRRLKIVDLRAMLKELREEGLLGTVEPQPYDPNRRNRHRYKGNDEG